MPLLFALLKIHLVLCIGYLLYRYCLSPLTFFRLNRIFLASVLLTAAAIPFLSFTLVRSTPEMLQTIRFPAAVIQAAAIPAKQEGGPLLWLKIAGWIYAAGIVAIASVSLFRMASLLALYRKSSKATYLGYPVRILKGNTNPFSCFGSIFLDPEQHHGDDLLAILQHEQAHIQQQHSIDLVLGILFKIACWCNPAAWLLDKAIRNNLEFLADEAVLHKGIAPRQYQYTLLHTAAGRSSPGLGHPFNATHLKNRIYMMNKARSSTLQLVRYGVALSLFTAPLLAVSFSFGQQQKVVRTAIPQEAAVEKNTSPQPLLLLADEKEQRSMQGIDPKRVRSVRVSKEPSETTERYGEKAANGVVKVYMETHDANGEVTEATDKPLIVIDDEIAENTSLTSIQPDRIESVTVLKGDNATVKYGDAGKNGVIQIRMKQ